MLSPLVSLLLAFPWVVKSWPLLVSVGEMVMQFVALGIVGFLGISHSGVVLVNRSDRDPSSSSCLHEHIDKLPVTLHFCDQKWPLLALQKILHGIGW